MYLTEEEERACHCLFTHSYTGSISLFKLVQVVGQYFDVEGALLRVSATVHSQVEDEFENRVLC